MALALAACGGGSSSGGSARVSVAPTPAPTASPTPVPSPAPSPAHSAAIPSIGAPALAITAPGLTSPAAVPGGPTFLTQPTATLRFPALQSTLTQAAGLQADTATMNGGTTFDFAYCTGCRETFVMNVPALGITQVGLNTFSDTPFTAALPNARTMFVEEATWGVNDVVWTKFGFWEIATSFLAFPITHSAYVYGYQTPAAALPTGGVVTYTGRVLGRVFYPVVAGSTAATRYVSGTATVRIDFGTRTVTGGVADMRAFDGFGASDSWNSMSFAASLQGGSSRFTGTAAATSGGAAPTGLAASATGTIAAQFHGPSGNELGLVWTLADGSRAALGASGAKF